MTATLKISQKLCNLGNNKDHSSFLPNLLKHCINRLLFNLRDERDFQDKSIKEIKEQVTKMKWPVIPWVTSFFFCVFS